LMVLGGKDKVISNKGATDWFDATAITDKDLVSYLDADHAML
jgi:alpha-beta hydrolase superfamily lysophospholipase